MQCPSCKNEIPKNAQFCPKCNLRFERSNPKNTKSIVKYSLFVIVLLGIIYAVFGSNSESKNSKETVSSYYYPTSNENIIKAIKILRNSDSNNGEIIVTSLKESEIIKQMFNRDLSKYNSKDLELFGLELCNAYIKTNHTLLIEWSFNIFEKIEQKPKSIIMAYIYFLYDKTNTAIINKTNKPALAQIINTELSTAPDIRRLIDLIFSQLNSVNYENISEISMIKSKSPGNQYEFVIWFTEYCKNTIIPNNEKINNQLCTHNPAPTTTQPTQVTQPMPPSESTAPSTVKAKPPIPVGTWNGTIGNKKITLEIEQTTDDAIVGYNQVENGKKRAIKGTYLATDDVYDIILKEPGDDKWDGQFELKMENDFKYYMKGTWKANNGKLVREVQFRKSPAPETKP